jgi:hypothetical protein
LPGDTAVAQFALFLLQQDKQCAIDIAEAEQAKVVSANDSSPERPKAKCPRDIRRDAGAAKVQPIVVVCSGWIL